MFCKNCGKEIEEGSKFCSNCGTNIETKTEKNDTASDFFSTLNTATQSSVKKKQVTPASGCAIVFVVFCLIIGFSVSTSTKVMNNAVNQQNEQRQMIEQYGVSYDDVDNIVKSCGFANYNFEYVGEENGIYYFIIRPKNGNTPGGLNIQNQQVISVDYANNILYKDGQVIHTLSDYVITSDERIDLIFETQTHINSVLKAPSTAKYPWEDEWNVGKDGNTGIITVQGYVDAQNGFGAMMRSQFQVQYQNNQVISLIFDGVEYIK